MADADFVVDALEEGLIEAEEGMVITGVYILHKINIPSPPNQSQN